MVFTVIQGNCAFLFTLHKMKTSPPLTTKAYRPLSEWLSTIFNPEKWFHALIERYTTLSWEGKVHNRLYFLSKLCLSIRVRHYKHIFSLVSLVILYNHLIEFVLTFSSHQFFISFYSSSFSHLCFLVWVNNSASSFSNALGGPWAHSESTRTLSPIQFPSYTDTCRNTVWYCAHAVIYRHVFSVAGIFFYLLSLRCSMYRLSLILPQSRSYRFSYS